MVSGEATVRATPDIIELIVNLQTVAATANQALRDSAAQMQKAAQGHADVQSLNLAITPLYNPAGAGAQAQAPHLAGYQVTNTFKLMLRDLTAAGAILDAAGGGATQIGCAVLFRVNDESRVRREALEAAARDARSKAEALSASIGKQIAEVLLISEDVTAPPPGNVPGDLTFRARVMATFRLR